MNIKSIIILVGFIALFAASYFTGWFCDKNFRLFLRKMKLSPFKAHIYRFRDAKIEEDKDHAVVCVNFQQLSFLSLLLGIICFVSHLVTNSKLVFLGSGALLVFMGAIFLFQLYTNTMKFKERQSQFLNTDETGFDEYKSPVTPSSVVRQPTRQAPLIVTTEETNNDKIDSLEKGRELIKNKGLLDDDIFAPFVTPPSNKFTNVRIREDFSAADDISVGKAILKDTIERQLKEEPFTNRNKFERSVNFYSKEDEVAFAEQGSASTGKDDK